jgi:hypothetical protein
MSDDTRFQAALPHALALVGAVHERDAHASHRILAEADLPALAVALAALVDDGQRVAQLLAWTSHEIRLIPDCDPELDLSKSGTRAVHGTRSRYTAGCRGDACRQAESEYQHDRYLRSKAHTGLREAS